MTVSDTHSSLVIVDQHAGPAEDSTHVSSQEATTDPSSKEDEDQPMPNVFPAIPMIRSALYLTPVPAACVNEPCIMGIDEAGRGPVLGPMVYAVCYLPAENEQVLRDMKVDDSKVLNEEQRDTRFHKIVAASDQIGFAYNALSQQDLSEWMLQRTKYNLNAIAHDTTMDLIQRVIRAGVRLSHVYVDTVGQCESYQRKLEQRFPGVGFTVAKKADSLYPTVSAASIVAKVVRDHVLSNWQFSETAVAEHLDTDWGSGYPSDPNTVAWLKRSLDPVFGFPGIIRFSWSTAENLLKEKVLVDGWPADREAEAANGGNLTKMLKRKRAQQQQAAEAAEHDAPKVVQGQSELREKLGVTSGSLVGGSSDGEEKSVRDWLMGE
ncbi:ribonuclease H-like domain-containing protein [Catenaria anguillulae PL171]|uniref:Ribonuclease n=1 Tax=Catenaria anguillulae PL171 TaxID=765915 RepID=A0A1Y2HH86_9FUNG|nr:ribonuclease H-like domain-containing protein [Catenaria anguillulae PL171]